MRLKAILLLLGVSSICFAQLDVMEVEGQPSEKDATTVFGEAEIGHHGDLQSLNEAFFLSPSVYLYQNGRRSALNVRGLGYTGGPPNPGIEPTNSIYIDGVYIPKTYFLAGDVIAIESISIAKGAKPYPNSSGVGNILINTPAPSVYKDSVFIEGGFGENNYSSLGLGGNYIVNGDSAIKYYWFNKETEGRYLNQYNNEKVNFTKVNGGHLKFLWNPTLDLEIAASYNEINDSSDWIGSGRSIAYLYTETQRRFFNISVPAATIAAGAMPSFATIYLPESFSPDTISNDLPNNSDTQNSLSIISAKYEWNYWNIQTTASYIDSVVQHFTDVDNTNFNLANQNLRENLDWLAGDFKFVYTNGDITVTNGFYLADSKSSYQTISYAGDDLLYLRAYIAENQQQRDYFMDLLLRAESYGKAAPVESKAVETRQESTYYLNLEIPLTSLANLEIGWRYSNITKDFAKYHSGLCGYSTAHLSNANCTPTTSFFVDKYYYQGEHSTDETGYSGFVNIGFDFVGDSYMELSLSRTKKIGGYSQTQSIGEEEGYVDSIDDLYYRPEYANSISIDLITPLRRVRSSLLFSVFYHLVKDYQLSYYDGLGFYTTNAEEVKSQGVELELNSNITKNVDWLSSFSYVDAMYVKNTNGPCAPEEYRSLENCNYLTWDAATSAGHTLHSDLSGETLRAPKVSLSTMLKLYLLQTSELTSDFTIEYEYIGKSRTTEFVHKDFERDGFSIWNIYFNMGSNSSGFDLGAKIKNATDKKMKIIEFSSPIIRKISGSPGGINAFLYPRRTFEISVKYVF